MCWQPWRWWTSCLTAILCVACPGGGDGRVPSNDVCDTPATRALIDTLDLGAGEEGAFRSLADGAVVQLVRGGQGGLMLSVRLRVTGSAVPACLAQTSEVHIAGQLVASLDAPLATYAEGAARTTRTLYLILSSPARAGDALVVRVSAGGKTLERTLWNALVGDAGTTGDGGG